MAARQDPESATHNATLREAMAEADARVAEENRQEREWERESRRMAPPRYSAAHSEWCAVSRHYNRGWIGTVPPPPPCTCERPKD